MESAYRDRLPIQSKKRRRKREFIGVRSAQLCEANAKGTGRLRNWGVLPPDRIVDRHVTQRRRCSLSGASNGEEQEDRDYAFHRLDRA
jgi:hypothetical protein